MTSDFENTVWLLSFYRTSEIAGSLFFGRLAKSLKPSQIQMDMTKHFADEAEHARLWTECLSKMGSMPLKLDETYQERYLSAVGLPSNLMEVLALTQVFERRVINQYARHRQVPDLEPIIKETLDLIMEDEKWHIQWIRDALKDMEKEYGADMIKETLRRYSQADQVAYSQALIEHGHKIHTLLGGRGEDENEGDENGE